MYRTASLLTFIALMPLLPSNTSAEDPSTTVDVSANNVSAKNAPVNTAIDFPGFVELSSQVQQLRQSRRVPIELFVEMARDPQTIILDTRSKRAFDQVHVAGAVHLNFSDFTAEKLQATIPSQTTRILIYCNNNFAQPKPTIVRQSRQVRSQDTDGDGKVDAVDLPGAVVQGLVNKSPRLALNIPTFINLHGYGYQNVYELADQLEIDDPRLTLEGTEITGDTREVVKRTPNPKFTETAQHLTP